MSRAARPLLVSGSIVLVGVLCVLLSACGSSSPSAHSPKTRSSPSSTKAAPSASAHTPKGVLASIVTAALAQKSVHWTGTDARDLYGTGHSATDVNGNSGAERLTYYGKVIRFLLVHHTVYVKGARILLEDKLHLTEAQAKHFAKRWISIPRGDKLYAQLSSGLTLASIVHDVTHDLTKQGKLKVRRRTSRGARLLDVRGTTRQSVFVYDLTARASGRPLPVAFSFSEVAGGSSARFSRWNEPVNVQAPASSTPITTVRG